MARPRHVRPAELGPRQIAGYFACFDHPREYASRGVSYIETLPRRMLDDELRRYGTDHRWPLLWDHGIDTADDPGKVTSVPIGHSVTVDPDGYGPFCVVELRRGQLADKVLEAARAGELGFSYHGVSPDPEITERGGRMYVTRHRMQLREISLTGRPAEPGALVLAVGGQAAALPDRTMDLDEAIDRVFAMTGHSRAAAELRVMRERAEREAAGRRHIRDLAGEARRLAFAVSSETARAARLRAEAAREAGRRPHDARRSPAVIFAESVTAGAAAEQAREALAELCANDQALIADVMRGRPRT